MLTPCSIVSSMSETDSPSPMSKSPIVAWRLVPLSRENVALPCPANLRVVGQNTRLRQTARKHSMPAAAPASRMATLSCPNLAPKGSTIAADRTFAKSATAPSGTDAGCSGSIGGLTRSTLCGAAEDDCIDAVKMTGGVATGTGTGAGTGGGGDISGGGREGDWAGAGAGRGGACGGVSGGRRGGGRRGGLGGGGGGGESPHNEQPLQAHFLQ